MARQSLMRPALLFVLLGCFVVILPFKGVFGQFSGSGCPNGTYCNGQPGNASCARAQPEACLACRPGELCAPSPYNPGGWAAAYLCPSGWYCPTPDKAPLPCPLGYFCPNGTFTLTTNISCLQPQFEGTYCPAGTGKPDLCPAGYFCPHPDQKYECQKGHFCVSGVTQMRDCTILTSCPEGASHPAMGFLGICVVLFVLLVRGIFYYVYFVKKRQSEEWYDDPNPRRTLIFANTPGQPRLSPLGPASPVIGGQGRFGPRYETLNSDYRVPKPFYLSFQNMRVTLANGVDILSNVNGVFQPARMCAVMGPSGAGKSTLLTALLGLNTATVSGQILINGDPTPLTHFQSEVAFVPQDDILLPELTVTDNLYYSAAWRLPSSIGGQQRRTIIAHNLKLLGLMHVKDSIVGDPERRGISGGQRKRVNIGLELVAHPGVLFLDEPTSGLDSTSSLDILNSLKELAVSANIPVVAVIHQPRMSIFQKFDDVLLLAKGGRTVYMGETASVVKYFNDLGYTIPAMENPADFLMDAIAGVVLPDDGVKPDLVAKWAEYEVRNNIAQEVSQKVEQARNEGAPEIRIQRSAIIQMWVFMRRSVNQLLRRPNDLLVDFLLISLGAGGTGFVFGPNGTWGVNRLESIILFSGLVLGLLSTMSGLNVFGGERLFFFREYTAGLGIVPYFLAKNIVMIYDVFVRPLIFTAIFYNFAQFFMAYKYYYVFFVALTYSTSGLGYLLSALVNPRNALLAAVVVPFVLGGMFSGFLPSMKDLKNSTVTLGISYASFGRWILESLVFLEYNAYPFALKPAGSKFFEERGYDLDWGVVTLSMIMLVVQGLVFRVLALLAMWADRVHFWSRTADKIANCFSSLRGKQTAKPNTGNGLGERLLDAPDATAESL